MMNINFIKTIFSFAAMAILFSSCENEPYEWVDSSEPKGETIEMVDLGLSVKWASCNIGASDPWVYGNFYSWGEINTKFSYNYNNSKTYGLSLGDISNNAEYDAAKAIWGDKWHMPTLEDFNELINKCSWVWTKLNGSNGYKVTGPSGMSIFFPAAGYYMNSSSNNGIGNYGFYWSSTPYGDDDLTASFLYFNSSEFGMSYINRYCGLNIRPVSY